MLAVACLASEAAFAQTLGSAEEIVVTAQRREQNVLDVGISVQTLSQDMLSERRIEQLRDLNAALPNVAVKEQVPGGIPVITIRGVGLDDFSTTNSPAAGIYVDEVPLSSLALMSFDFYDLERVEIVRGPQGTLYGRNTTAGAINVLTARPTDQFEARLSGGYGSYERTEVEGMLNLPLSARAALRLAGRAVNQDEGFWQSRLLPGETIGDHAVLQVRAQLALDLGENWRANLVLGGIRQRSEMGIGEHFGTMNLVTGVPPNFTCGPVSLGRLDPTQCTDLFGYADTDNDPFKGDWPIEPRYDINQSNATLRLERDIGAATLTVITGYIDFDRDFYIDADASPLRQFEFNQMDWVEQFTQEVRLSGETSGVNWTAGAFYSSDDIRVRTPGFFDDLFGTEVLISADQEGRSFAVYSQVEAPLTTRLNLIAGARYTSEEKEYLGGTFDQNPFGVSALVGPACPSASAPCQLSFADLAIEDEFWSWRLGLDWRLTEDSLAYFSVSRGQKSGGFFTGFTLADAQLAPYESEELTAYEIGYKWRSRDARLRGEIAAFYYDYANLQTFVRVDLGPISVQALRNVPEAEISGVDASFSWLPVDELTLQVGVGYLDTELGAFDTVAGTVPAGNELPNAPGFSMSARAIYERSLGADTVLRVQLGANYADGAFKDSLNDPLIASDSAWVFDGRISVGAQDDDWELALWGHNLTDERYVGQGLNSGLGAGNRHFNAPRTYGVSVTRRFQ